MRLQMLKKQRAERAAALHLPEIPAEARIAAHGVIARIASHALSKKAAADVRSLVTKALWKIYTDPRGEVERLRLLELKTPRLPRDFVDLALRAACASNSFAALGNRNAAILRGLGVMPARFERVLWTVFRGAIHSEWRDVCKVKLINAVVKSDWSERLRLFGMKASVHEVADSIGKVNFSYDKFAAEGKNVSDKDRLVAALFADISYGVKRSLRAFLIRELRSGTDRRIFDRSAAESHAAGAADETALAPGAWPRRMQSAPQSRRDLNLALAYLRRRQAGPSSNLKRLSRGARRAQILGQLLGPFFGRNLELVEADAGAITRLLKALEKNTELSQRLFLAKDAQVEQLNLPKPVLQALNVAESPKLVTPSRERQLELNQTRRELWKLLHPTASQEIRTLLARVAGEIILASGSFSASSLTAEDLVNQIQSQERIVPAPDTKELRANFLRAASVAVVRYLLERSYLKSRISVFRGLNQGDSEEQLAERCLSLNQITSCSRVVRFDFPECRFLFVSPWADCEPLARSFTRRSN